MSILKVNTALFFVFALTISGGVYAQKLLTPHPRFHPLLSQPLKKYPGLKFHPHSEHYIYNFDTVEETDKPEFKVLASKLSKLPSNFPSTITLATVSASSVASSEVLNQGELLTNRELYLISKYWLQLLPQFHPELLKCLAGPTSQSQKPEDQFPSNCPSEIRYLNENTEESSSTTTITNKSFNIPYTLYAKLQKCSNSKCQAQSKDCYCEEKSCTPPCKSQKTLSIGPRFFTPTIPSKFFYPSPSSQSPDKFETFNATGNSKPNNPKPLPHFSFPLPHSSHSSIYTQTTNSTSVNDNGSLDKPIHWPQSITIYTNFTLQINNQNYSTDNKTAQTSLDTLVSKLLSSTFKLQGKPLIQNSPTQLFFVRYLATLYALLWSYSPHSLPLFPSNGDTSLLSEHNFDSLSPTTNTSPLFNIHPQTQSTQK